LSTLGFEGLVTHMVKVHPLAVLDMVPVLVAVVTRT